MIAGIDLGGTQVRLALAGSDGRIVSSVRTRTALLGTPRALATWVSEQVVRHGGGDRVRHAAIGAPGPIDTRNGVLVNPPNLLGWKNVPLSAMLGGVTQSWRQVAPVMEQVLRASPIIKPARRPRLRRGSLGDRAGQMGAVEWARTHL
jgi:predicted NBD/HSP70 family sugar kinase